MRARLRAAAVALTAATAAVLFGAGPGSAAAGQVAEQILIMGSSTTACAGQLSSPANCYVNIVKAAHPADTFTVLGRGGTYIGYGTAAQNWTTTPIPGGHDRVVIQLGINDWYVPVAPATLRQQIDGLVIRVKAANPGAKIAWVRTWMPVPTGNADVRQSMWAQHGWSTADAMSYARTACNPNCTPVADFIDMGTSPAPRRSTVSGDNGWHYNDRGHAEIAAAVNRWIDQN
jgi:lysophospholipase L1-like esterase